MSKAKYKNRDWLYQEYIVDGKSTSQIANEHGCGSTTICTWLKKHNIPTRSLSEAVSKAKEPDKPYTDEHWLKQEYIQKGKSISKIADELGVSRTPITYWLGKHEIETRDPGHNTAKEKHKHGPWDDAEWLRSQYIESSKSTTDIAEEHGVSTSLIRSRLEEFGIDRRSPGVKGNRWLESREYTKEQWLRKQYIKEQKSTPEIASQCGVSADTIIYWLEKHGIERCDPGAPAGEDHHWWAGGENNGYGPGWNATKKRQVRERDDYRCRDCGMNQKDHKSKWGEKIHVHHLIKAREFDDPEERNSIENLITLCRDCHREWEKLSEARIRPQIDAHAPTPGGADAEADD